MYNLFIPLVMMAAYATTPGVQIERNRIDDYYMYVAPAGNIKYVFDWYRIETSPGVYNWNDYDLQMAAVPEDSDLLITVRNAPVWHRTDPLRECSDVLSTSYDDYTTFVKLVIDRYDPDAIEIWNEFDATSSSYPTLFGCFTDVNNYIALSQYTCSDLAITRPNVTTVTGGTTSINSQLLQIPVNTCDVVSFHYYTYASNPAPDANYVDIQAGVNLLLSNGWNRVWISETAMLWADDMDKQLHQANYYNYLTYNLTGAERFYWYTISGNKWAMSDLRDDYNNPRLAYYAYINRFFDFPLYDDQK